MRGGGSYGEVFIDIELDFLARQGPDSTDGRSTRSAIVRIWEGGHGWGALDLHFEGGFAGP